MIIILNTIPSLQEKDYVGQDVDNSQLSIVEIVCITWFTLEYLLRFFSAPNKRKFLKAPLNVMDVITVLPSVISLFLVKIIFDRETFISYICRPMRFLLILKLVRHSSGLQNLGFTLRNSYKELGLLMLFLLIGVVSFSSLEYFAEKDELETKYISIAETFWWAFSTMIAGSYGDMAPTSILGKVIGILCCISGILVTSLPIPIIVNNFSESYKNRMHQKKVLKAREAIEQAQKNAGIVAFKHFQDGFNKRMDLVGVLKNTQHNVKIVRMFLISVFVLKFYGIIL